MACPQGCGHMARSDNIKTHARSCPRRSLPDSSLGQPFQPGPHVEAEAQQNELRGDALAHAHQPGNSTGFAFTDSTYV